jgi:hypothetical protein
VGEATVSGWIQNLIPNKSLNIGTFRSLVVSYYYPKSNNQAKTIIYKRIRTSASELIRAYLKFYNTPDTLAQVLINPSVDLVNRGKSGKGNKPIIVENANSNIRIKQEPDEIVSNAPIRNTITTNDVHERKRINAKDWYEKIKSTI